MNRVYIEMAQLSRHESKRYEPCTCMRKKTREMQSKERGHKNFK